MIREPDFFCNRKKTFSHFWDKVRIEIKNAGRNYIHYKNLLALVFVMCCNVFNVTVKDVAQGVNGIHADAFIML